MRQVESWQKSLKKWHPILQQYKTLKMMESGKKSRKTLEIETIHQDQEGLNHLSIIGQDLN